jgi:uncharacterized SAM-binding protein YcdF (DUF218 family)
MTFYLSNVFWLIAAPTNALLLISAIAALWAALGSSQCAARLAAGAACSLVIGAFTPIGLMLIMPLEHRFAVPPTDSEDPPNGIIVLAGGGGGVIAAASALSQEYPEARLILSGFSGSDENLLKRALHGVDPARVYIEPRPRTTFEDALYTAALLKPKSSERWLLVTSALHMPRAVGCFRLAGFQVAPYQVEAITHGSSGPFAFFRPGPLALAQFNTALREWVGLVAYRLMGKTDALFPNP